MLFGVVSTNAADLHGVTVACGDTATGNVLVVGVTGLEYRIGADAWTSLTNPVHIAKDTTVQFKASPSLTDVWPAEKPAWGGVLSGAGIATNAATFSDLSANGSDYKLATAECGNSTYGNGVTS